MLIIGFLFCIFGGLFIVLWCRAHQEHKRVFKLQSENLQDAWEILMDRKKDINTK